jgi:hypothetical protein
MPPVQVEEDEVEIAAEQRSPLNPMAQLNIDIEFINKDMLSTGSQLFYQSIPNPATFLRDLILAVVNQLYCYDLENCPPLKQLHFYLEHIDSGAPAYVTNDRIALISTLHLNSTYLAKFMHLGKTNSLKSSTKPPCKPLDIQRPALAQLQHEIAGVLTHELVHIFQYDGQGKAPGGLIEGLADLVRLRCGYIPRHWSPMHALPDRWDCGYEKTAFFLTWFEEFWIRQSSVKPDRPLAMLLNLRLMTALED